MQLARISICNTIASHTFIRAKQNQHFWWTLHMSAECNCWKQFVVGRFKWNSIDAFSAAAFRKCGTAFVTFLFLILIALCLLFILSKPKLSLKILTLSLLFRWVEKAFFEHTRVASSTILCPWYNWYHHELLSKSKLSLNGQSWMCPSADNMEPLKLSLS